MDTLNNSAHFFIVSVVRGIFSFSYFDIAATGDEKPALEEIIKSLDELSAIAQSLKAWSEKNL